MFVGHLHKNKQLDWNDSTIIKYNKYTNTVLKHKFLFINKYVGTVFLNIHLFMHF